MAAWEFVHSLHLCVFAFKNVGMQTHQRCIISCLHCLRWRSFPGVALQRAYTSICFRNIHSVAYETLFVCECTALAPSLQHAMQCPSDIHVYLYASIDIDTCICICLFAFITQSAPQISIFPSKKKRHKTTKQQGAGNLFSISNFWVCFSILIIPCVWRHGFKNIGRRDVCMWRGANSGVSFDPAGVDSPIICVLSFGPPII